MEGVKVNIDTQQKFQMLEMIIDKQSKELTRLSNAIERISIAMTAVRIKDPALQVKRYGHATRSKAK